MVEFNLDAFASGQVGSKLWLCEKLESIWPADKAINMWLLGGWYGMLPFLISSRGSLKLSEVVNFDLDINSHEIYYKVLDFWKWKNQLTLSACEKDCNQIEYLKWNEYSQNAPNLIINTSVEHMPHNEWWERIPVGTFVVLQSCNMKHDDHVKECNSVEELEEDYPLSNKLYSGEKYFDYNGPTSFSRFMIIGEK